MNPGLISGPLTLYRTLRDCSMSGEVCSSASSNAAFAAAGGALPHPLPKGNGSACPSPVPLTPLKSPLCVLWHQRVLIDRSQQPDAELDTDPRGQGPGWSADGGSLSQAVVPGTAP